MFIAEPRRSNCFELLPIRRRLSSFVDSGLPYQTELPPDPQFDHVNLYWRWELLPETGAAIVSGNTIGNATLQMKPNRFSGATVRITRGKGAAQEATIASNTATTLAIMTPWAIEPDATSWFTVAESSWRTRSKGKCQSLKHRCAGEDRRRCTRDGARRERRKHRSCIPAFAAHSMGAWPVWRSGSRRRCSAGSGLRVGNIERRRVDSAGSDFIREVWRTPGVSRPARLRSAITTK